MSDTGTLIISMVGFLVFITAVIGFVITRAKRTKRECPKCHTSTYVSKSYYQEKGTGKQQEGVIDQANGYFAGVLEIIVGIMSLAWFIFMLSGLSSGGCSLDGLSVVCEGSSVSTMTGIGWYIFPLLLAVAAPLDGVKRLQHTSASKGKVMECHFKCGNCKTEWTESITEDSTARKEMEKRADVSAIPPRKFIIIVHLLSVFLPPLIFTTTIVLSVGNLSPAQLFTDLWVTLLVAAWFFLYYLLAGGMEWKTQKLPLWRMILFWLLTDFVLGLILYGIWYLIRYLMAKSLKIPMTIARGHLLRRRSTYK